VTDAFDRLAKFRPGVIPEGKPLIEVLDEREVRFHGVLLCCDQTISKTGWSILRCNTDTQTIVVTDTGMIVTPPTGIKGYQDYLLRGEDLALALQPLIEHRNPDVIVHEEPPMGTGLRSPESSLAAAMVIRIVGQQHKIKTVSVHSKKAKKHLTGNGNADKKEVREVVLGRVRMLADKPRMNYDISDAIALGVTLATGGA
jgi:Holliday junction resolvasome RuvABC endonuclease subunit